MGRAITADRKVRREAWHGVVTGMAEDDVEMLASSMVVHRTVQQTRGKTSLAFSWLSQQTNKGIPRSCLWSWRLT
jgi:hypothetical protein